MIVKIEVCTAIIHQVKSSCVKAWNATGLHAGRASLIVCLQDGNVAQWKVWSGGRIGAVFGEDALENGPPAVTCTSDCEAQNRVRGSLLVTTMPEFIVPIGEDEFDEDD
ncbi:hypothetical protein S40288_11192 [Stachybotrys chartarum IBT 40288]|nr:hypothetical protein S40288_11192 [Stachybotrys chartarum IBT 40288]